MHWCGTDVMSKIWNCASVGMRNSCDLQLPATLLSESNWLWRVSVKVVVRVAIAAVSVISRKR